MRGSWRFPSEPRATFPTHWVHVYSWRSVLGHTPRIKNTSLQIAWHNLPRGVRLGLWLDRDDDDEWNLVAGLLLAQVTVNVIKFWPSVHLGRSSTEGSEA